jgi:hypothetical protein
MSEFTFTVDPDRLREVREVMGNPNEELAQEKADLNKLRPDILKEFSLGLPGKRPNCKICIVVPTSGEIKNDNFWNMIRAFLKQGSDMSEFEIIFVVNNPEIALTLSQQSLLQKIRNYFTTKNQKLLNSTHLQTRTSAAELIRRYNENQFQIALLKKITEAQKEYQKEENQKEEDQKKSTTLEKLVANIVEDLSQSFPSVEISAHEVGLISRMIEKGIQVGAIDLSSESRALENNPNQNPVAYSRWIGGIIAHDRLGPQGIIDFLDADSYPGHSYIQTKLKKDPDSFDYLIDTMSPVITEIPKAISKLPKAQRYDRLIQYIRSHFYKYAIYYPKITYALAVNRMSYPGGPQLSLSKKAHDAIGGYARVLYSEDFETAHRAMGNNRRGVLSPIRQAMVYVSDRSRPGSIDGSLRSEKQIIDRSRYVPIMIRIIQLDKTLINYPNTKVKEAYKDFRKLHFKAEKMKQLFFLNRIEKIINLCLLFWNSKPRGTSSELIGYLSKHISPREIDFIQQNSILIDFLKNKILRNVNKPFNLQIVMQKLKDELPELFYTPATSEPEYSEQDILANENINFRNLIHILSAATDVLIASKTIGLNQEELSELQSTLSQHLV